MRILPLSPTAWGLLVMTIVLDQTVVADNDNLFLGAVVLSSGLLVPQHGFSPPPFIG